MADMDDDPIIELNDIADKNSEVSTSQEILELTEITEDENSNDDFKVDEKDDFGLEISDFDDDHQDVQDELQDFDLLDSDLEEDFFEVTEHDEQDQEDIDTLEVVSESGNSIPGNLNIDQEQIEIILERIIEKKFAEKIENLLFDVMEKVIKKQIIKTKESLQKDLE
jgi:hypothetical protein